jgi:hypothetical protein
MREHHPRFLPQAFSDLRVESGGVGAGKITHFNMTVGAARHLRGRTQRLDAHAREHRSA